MGNGGIDEKERGNLIFFFFSFTSDTSVGYLADSPKIPEIITRSSNQRDCSSPKAAAKQQVNCLRKEMFCLKEMPIEQNIQFNY